MKLHAIFLAAFAGFASAMPLRMGASLGYRVWRGWERDSSFVTLTVFAKSTTDSAESWMVAIRDSGLGRSSIRSDTASIRASSSDTSWLNPSCLVAWDLGPSSSAPILSYSSTRIPAEGALLAAACFHERTPDASTSWAPSSSFVGSWDGSARTMGDWNNGMALGLPATVRLDDTGWARLRDTVSREDWTLVQVDGQELAGTRAWQTTSVLVAGLEVGERWAWTLTDHSEGGTKWGGDQAPATDTASLTWTIIGAVDDSAGWVRRTVRSESTDDSLAFGAFALRLQPSTGRHFTNTGKMTGEWLAGGFLRLWSDDSLGRGQWLRTKGSTEAKSLSTRSDSATVGSLDGVGPCWLRLSHREKVSMSSWSEHALEVVLTMHNGDRIQVAAERASHHRNGSEWRSAKELLADLEATPGATVRLASLSGRSTIVEGAAARARLRDWHGVVQVEVIELGRIRRGKLLIP